MFQGQILYSLEQPGLVEVSLAIAEVSGFKHSLSPTDILWFYDFVILCTIRLLYILGDKFYFHSDIFEVMPDLYKYDQESEVIHHSIHHSIL